MHALRSNKMEKQKKKYIKIRHIFWIVCGSEAWCVLVVALPTRVSTAHRPYDQKAALQTHKLHSRSLWLLRLLLLWFKLVNECPPNRSASHVFFFIVFKVCIDMGFLLSVYTNIQIYTIIHTILYIGEEEKLCCMN